MMNACRWSSEMGSAMASCLIDLRIIAQSLTPLLILSLWKSLSEQNYISNK